MAGELMLLYVIVSVETTLLLSIIVVLRVVIWPLYVNTRNECAVAEERLQAVTAGRDGWREVAERTLLVAREGKKVTERAARLAAKANGLS